MLAVAETRSTRKHKQQPCRQCEQMGSPAHGGAPCLPCLDDPSTKHSPLFGYVNSVSIYTEYGFLPFRGYGLTSNVVRLLTWLLARGRGILFGLPPPHRLGILQ
jgi:hypothetical protein